MKLTQWSCIFNSIVCAHATAIIVSVSSTTDECPGIDIIQIAINPGATGTLDTNGGSMVYSTRTVYQNEAYLSSAGQYTGTSFPHVLAESATQPITKDPSMAATVSINTDWNDEILINGYAIYQYAVDDDNNTAMGMNGNWLVMRSNGDRYDCTTEYPSASPTVAPTESPTNAPTLYPTSANESSISAAGAGASGGESNTPEADAFRSYLIPGLVLSGALLVWIIAQKIGCIS